MPMSSHIARQGHVILRTVLMALSVVVLAVSVLMWWLTAFGTSDPMATEGAGQPASHLASNTDASSQ